MNITIINSQRKEKRYTRMELERFVDMVKDDTAPHNFIEDYRKEVCFAGVWMKRGGTVELRERNPLVLLSLENLRDLTTAIGYQHLANQLPYTLLTFLGAGGHSLDIVCRFQVADGDKGADLTDEALDTALVNAFNKLHYLYSAHLGTALAERHPTRADVCPVSYDPQPFYNPEAIALTVTATPEKSPEYRAIQEDISDYNRPEEIPGLSVYASRMRRFHDCLDEAIAHHRDIRKDDLFATAVLERLADGCHKMGLPQAWSARMATFIPMLGGMDNSEVIDTVFRTAYLREQLQALPLKYTRPSALLAYKTEAYMKEHYTLRLNVMTGTPEYRLNAVGYGFAPLDQATRNTMAIKALKAGVDSWDKDLSRYIDSNLIPRYYPMEDYISHLKPWDKKHDYVGQLAERVHTDNPHWQNDFHTWMLSMVAQWMGKDRQYGNAIVPLLIGPQGSGKTTFCRRLLPGFLQTYYNDRLSMKNDGDIFIAMSSYALINIDEFDAMSKSQQPLLKYLISKQDVKFRPPYGKVMEERRRFASFIATTNNRRPLVDPTGSRRFICVYADSIDNSGNVPHDQLYAQLYHELQEGRRYWFDDDENARITHENEQFQQVSNYERMIELTFVAPHLLPPDADFISVQDVARQLSQLFPTFTIGKTTLSTLGRQLTQMGYEAKHTNRGNQFRIARQQVDEK